MAITIRTGANGSYKSAYVAYFVIFEALKAGKVVVTNIEGMEPLDVIEKRFDMVLPSTSKLIRVTSRDAAGVNLWTHFFCWCPIGAQIVIDECQDIFSKNIGFDMKKVNYKPVEDFITKDGGKDGLLPESYLSFFYSRYVPADMEQLQACETDDRGIAEYDEQGRIIYPHSFNEGFMRHRKYNWDIELLSPDWKQIDSSIKACGEQNFYHKGRDHFFWCRRKPFIWKHDKAVSTPAIPKKKDVTLMTKKIPLDAHLLYKSTGTGKAQDTGALNPLFYSPKFIFFSLVGLFCLGYFVYGLSGLVFGDDAQVSQPQTIEFERPATGDNSTQTFQGVQNPSTVYTGGNSDPNSIHDGSQIPTVSYKDVLPFDGIQKAFLTGFNTRRVIKNTPTERSSRLDEFVSIDVVTDDGVYALNERYLAYNDVSYQLIDSCLMELERAGQKKLITCKPLEVIQPEPDEPSMANINLF